MTNPSIAIWLLAGLIALPPVATAHPPDAHDSHSSASPISEEAKPVLAVVDEFSSALKAGDLKRAAALLSEDVLILESGSAERSREEYLGHHAAEDAAFLKNARIEIKRRTVHVVGPIAWVGTESELSSTRDSAPLTLLSTETTVLARTDGAWRIVHIHWSSHPKR